MKTVVSRKSNGLEKNFAREVRQFSVAPNWSSESIGLKTYFADSSTENRTTTVVSDITETVSILKGKKKIAEEDLNTWLTSYNEKNMGRYPTLLECLNKTQETFNGLDIKGEYKEFPLEIAGSEHSKLLNQAKANKDLAEGAASRGANTPSSIINENKAIKYKALYLLEAKKVRGLEDLIEKYVNNPEAMTPAQLHTLATEIIMSVLAEQVS